MGAFVEKYVLGYEVCQCYKSPTHPQAILKFHEVPAGPWEHVGANLIAQLPLSHGFNAIRLYIDYYSDQTHLIPCMSTLTAEGTTDLHYKDIFGLHRISKKIFSNCSPQFAACYMHTLYKHLNIKTGLTTAYHPQDNGKVQHKN